MTKGSSTRTTRIDCFTHFAWALCFSIGKNNIEGEILTIFGEYDKQLGFGLDKLFNGVSILGNQIPGIG